MPSSALLGYRGTTACAVCLAAFAFSLAAFAGQPTPLPEAGENTIGFASVEAALAALHARPDVTWSTRDGWLVAMDPRGPTTWSFPPKGHPAYPSAVKRTIVNGPDGADVNTDVHCEASKAACDDLVRSFEVLDDQMTQSLKGR